MCRPRLRPLLYTKQVAWSPYTCSLGITWKLWNRLSQVYSSWKISESEFHDSPLPFPHSSPFKPILHLLRGMGIDSRRWQVSFTEIAWFGKDGSFWIVSSWIRKILSELPFSPCVNSRNQATTALGERLFLDFHSDKDLEEVSTSDPLCRHPTAQLKTA